MDGMGEILPPETGVQAGPAPMPAAMSQYNLLSTAFKAPEFIHTFGALTDRTVLDYFAQSPFFDRQSTNQMLRMQAVELVPVGRWTSAEEADKLRAFVGIEYIVAHSSPPNLFVIHRRYRSSPQEAHVQAAYFVLNDAIMQSPELFTILDNRLTATYDSIYQSMAAARTAQPPVDLRMSASTARAFKVYQPTVPEPEADSVTEQPSSRETNMVPDDQRSGAKRSGEAGGETSEKRVRIAP